VSARGVAGTVLCVAMAVVPLSTARAAPEDLANEIAAKVMSPFCPGVTLENCPSDKAAALRARIQSWAENGWGEDRILAELVELYGDPIRAVPPASGSGLWAWLAPALALAGGAALAVALARRWTRAPDDPSSKAAPVVPPETRARLEDELNALRGRP
jgi:cytochrome c-type biogenesis protein CcmH/NrfF